MREWLTRGILEAAQDLPDEMVGFALGRGLKRQLMEDMRVGVWSAPSSEAPDSIYRERNGARGEWRRGWMTIPYWTPRGLLAGVEYRTWGYGEKKVRDYRLPRAKFSPVFMGLTPAALQRIWDGGSVWLVEGVFDMALAHVIPETDVVLGCGTARVTRNQLNFLKRFMDSRATVHIVFDMDPTGQRQIDGFEDESGRRIPGVPDRMDRVGLRNRAVRFRGGKDPGEIWEKGGKSGLFRAFYPRGH